MKHWTLYNAEGELIGAGDGAVQANGGEYLVYSDSDDGGADSLLSSIKRKGEVYDANNQNDDALLEEKYYTALKYLTEVTRPLSYDDPNVIDGSKYPILYDEYWATYDLTPFTPAELAGVIIKRFQEKIAQGSYKTPSMKEADRRRKKLLAEKELAENPVPTLSPDQLLELTLDASASPLATESGSK